MPATGVGCAPTGHVRANPSAHEGMETSTVVPDARHGLGPGSLLCLDSSGEEKGEAHHGENSSHDVPQKKEGVSLRVSSPGHDPAGSGEEL